MHRSDLKHFAICVAIWSTTWFAITFQVDRVAPAVSVAWRFGLAAMLLALYCRLRGHTLRTSSAAQRELIAMGAFMFFGGYVLVYYAETRLVSGLVALGYSTSPLVNMLASRVAFGTPISARVTAGGLLGLLGVACVFWPELARFEGDARSLAGVALTAAAVLASTLGNVFSSRAQRHAGSLWQKMAWAMGWGALLAMLFALANGHSMAIPLAPRFLGALLYLALAGSIFAFASYLTLLETIGAARAGYVGVIVPIVALMISSLFEEYAWHPLAFVGIAIVAAGNLIMLGQPLRGAIRRRTLR